MRSRWTLTAAAAVALLSPASAFAHGASVSTSKLGSSWHAEPAVLAPVGVVALLFVQAFVRLRRRARSDHAGVERALLFALALCVGTLALVSPLDAAGERYLLSAHMLQHMLIGDAAPALALTALRGPLLFFLVPPFILAPLARVHAVRSSLGWLLRPVVALSLWAVVFGIWHVPLIYDATLRHQWLHDIEHASFVLAGLAVWTQIVDPARHNRLVIPGRIAIAVTVFAAGQILSYVLIFSLHALYPAYAEQRQRLFGWSPVLDQQLAGLVMMVEQLLTLGTATGILLASVVRRRRRVAISADRRTA